MGCIESTIINKNSIKDENEQISNIQDSGKLFEGIQDVFQLHKIINYYRFIMMKLALRKIIHRKIVHRIQSKYLQQLKLVLNRGDYYDYKNFQLLSLDLQEQQSKLSNLSLKLYRNGLGQIRENQKLLVQALQSLQRLKYLELDFRDNHINSDIHFFKTLSEGLQKLIILERFSLGLIGNSIGKTELMCNFEKCFKNFYKLQYLNINFMGNDLGYTKENFIYIKQSFKPLWKNLIELDLNLKKNNLLGDKENCKYLGESIQQLVNLQYLSMNLADNQIGRREENLNYLGNSLRKLQNLKRLILDLGSNELGKKEQNFIYIGDIFVYLQGLRQLELNLENNGIGEIANNLKNLLENFKLLGNLKRLSLNLKKNNLNQQDQSIQNLGEGLKKLFSNNNGLQSLALNLSYNNLNMHSSRYIKEQSFKGVNINSLENLEIDVSFNKFGSNVIDFKHFEEIFQRLQNLKSLKLNLSYLNFEKRQEDDFNKIMMQNMQKLSNLTKLELVLYSWSISNIQTINKLIKNQKDFPNLMQFDITPNN